MCGVDVMSIHHPDSNGFIATDEVFLGGEKCGVVIGTLHLADMFEWITSIPLNKDFECLVSRS